MEDVDVLNSELKWMKNIFHVNAHGLNNVNVYAGKKSVGKDYLEYIENGSILTTT